MDSFFVRFKNPLVLIAIVLAQTIGLAIQVQPTRTSNGPTGPDGKKTSLLRYWLSTISVACGSPLRNYLS